MTFIPAMPVTFFSNFAERSTPADDIKSKLTGLGALLPWSWQWCGNLDGKPLKTAEFKLGWAESTRQERG